MGTHRLITSGSLLRLETALFQQVQEQKRNNPFGPVVVLCASGFLGHYLSRELARRGSPHVGISFLTFNDLARSLARRALLEKKSTPVPEGGKELIARKLVGALPPGSYFAGVRDQPHLPPVLTAAFTDIEDSCIDFAAASEQAVYPSPISRRKVSEVVQLYGQYSAELCRHMFTEAGLLAEAGRSGDGFAAQFGTDKLLVYGFYELTGAQRELLHRLAPHVSVTAFLLAEEGTRLSASQALHDWWLARPAIEEKLAPEEVVNDLHALRRRVFTDAGSMRADDGSVRALSCADEVSEAREIAREAVRLRREAGVAFTEMAVVVRDTATYLPLLAGVFERIGLPLYVREGLPLGAAATGRSILAALRLPDTNYVRSEVMQWLTSGALDARALTNDRSEAPVTLWDRISAEAGIVGGESQWRERLRAQLASYAARLQAAAEEHTPALRYRAAQTEKLLAFVEQLFAAGREWRMQRTWTALADSVVVFLRRFHAAGDERDQVQDALWSLRNLDRFGQPAEPGEFLAVAETMLAGCSRQAGVLEQTGVHLLPLAAARHTHFRVVFVPGLTERSFPLVGRQDSILLDEERRALSPAGDPGLPLKSVRPREERLLFRLALEAAHERLVLTMPRAEAVSGAEKIPSYYLLRSLECLAGRQISYADLRHPGDLPRLVYLPGSHLLSQSSRTAIDEREFDLGTIKACLASEHPEASLYLQRCSPNFARAVEAEQAQWGARTFTVYDGVLATPGCRRALSELFSGERVYSATALERYANCPYHFFLSDVLRLEELEDPSSRDELGARDKGELMHAILRDFYGEMKARKRLPLAADHLQIYRKELAAICHRHFRRAEREGLTGPAATWAEQQKFIIQDLEGYLQAEIDGGDCWLPEDFERVFEVDGAACLGAPIAGGKLKLRGQIDRLDLSPDRKSVRVIDYKSGKARYPRKVDLAGGTALQLPLYLLAAAFDKRMDLRSSSAEYCYVTRAAGWKRCEFTGGALAEKRADVREILETIVRGCRNGIFPRCPDTKPALPCGQCEFARIGDPRHETLWQRKQADPCLASFRQMRAKV